MKTLSNINFVAEAKKNYVKNNGDAIIRGVESLYRTVEVMTLFVNDQAYNYTILLEEKLKESKLYRNQVKKFFNGLKKAILTYNYSLYVCNKSKGEIIADVTQVMEDELSSFIEEIGAATKEVLNRKEMPEENRSIATLSLIVSCMAVTSQRLISSGNHIIQEMGINPSQNPFQILKIDKVLYYAVKLSDALTDGEVQMEGEDCKRLSEALDAFLDKMSSEEMSDKIFDAIEQHKDEE